MTIQAVLLDLDDTLLPDGRAARAAFRETARRAAERRLLDPYRLAPVARQTARRIWKASPASAYGRRVGMSSWEGLWARLETSEGEEEDHAALRAWLPTYRRRAWEESLRSLGVRDPVLAPDLARTFGLERRRRLRPYADALPLLDALEGRFGVAIVTNGAPEQQREKLERSGLEARLPVVVISGEVGIKKPDPRPFEVALERLGAGVGDAVMVGNSLRSDVGGARAAGIRSIWLDRAGHGLPEGDGPVPDAVVRDLASLPEAIA